MRCFPYHSPGLLLAVLLLPLATPGQAGERPPASDPAPESPDLPSSFLTRHFGKFIDPEDGAFDLSHFLDQPFGFFPLVTPITEPAIGAGAAIVPLFIDQPHTKGARPNIWAAGAMRTSNGSQGYFGGYSGYFAQDKWHVFGGAGKFSVNLDFHGLGDLTTPGGDPLRYNLDAIGGLIGADRRIGDSPWRIGLRYLYGQVDPSLDRSSDSAIISAPDFIDKFGPFDFSSTVSSLQGSILYDTRDNIFTPTAGLYAEFNPTINLTALGASEDYQILAGTAIWYKPLVEDHLFLGWRVDFKQSFGDIPFYRRPSVQLRGAPAQRYQGAGVASTEAELRWQILPRWSLLTFGGTGITWPGDAPFQEPETVVTGGVGFRYLVARRHGLHAGIDLALGEEGAAVYIQFGSAWFRP